MDELNLDDVGQKERWLDLGGVQFLVRYCSPKESDRFRNRMLVAGIMRRGRDGTVELTMGRERDFYRCFAEQYILGWRGNIKPEGAPYSAEKMGEQLERRGDLLKAIQDAVMEVESFFHSNGAS